MKRCDLDKALPEGIRSFDEWEAKIPKYQTPLMKRLDSLDLGSRRRTGPGPRCTRSCSGS